MQNKVISHLNFMYEKYSGRPVRTGEHNNRNKRIEGTFMYGRLSLCSGGGVSPQSPASPPPTTTPSNSHQSCEIGKTVCGGEKTMPPLSTTGARILVSTTVVKGCQLSFIEVNLREITATS